MAGYSVEVNWHALQWHIIWKVFGPGFQGVGLLNFFNLFT